MKRKEGKRDEAMYKVLIAEDELFVRLGIKNSVCWAEYQMQVLADVKDGAAAWQQVRQHAPDILITDILMPALDGRQLVKKVSEGYPDIYIIVISCLDDFATVQGLLSHGIRDYLLKSTMTEQNIKDCLHKAYRYLQKNSPISQKHMRLPPALQREQLLRLYLKGDLGDRQLYEKVLPDLPQTGCPAVLCLCQIDAVYEAEVSALYRDICRNAADLLSNQAYPHVHRWVFPLDDRRLLCLLFARDNGTKEDAAAAAKALQRDACEYLNIHLSLVISFLSHAEGGLRCAYKQARACMQFRYLNAEDEVIQTWDFDPKQNVREACKELEAYREWMMRYMDYNAAQGYLRILKNFAKRAMQSREEMVFMLKSILQLFRRESKDGLDECIERCSRSIDQAPFLKNAVKILSSFLQQYIHGCLPEGKEIARLEILRALQFIQKNAANANLSLAAVSSEAGLSEAYFSTLFRHEMGMPFIRYLGNLRIELAKSLLRDTNNKLASIARQCGFSDDAYFSRAFKKAVGISPGEWRSQCHKKQ